MVFQAQDDADVNITKATFNNANEYSTMLIVEDTVLFIILYYAEANGNHCILDRISSQEEFQKCITSIT